MTQEFYWLIERVGQSPVMYWAGPMVALHSLRVVYDAEKAYRLPRDAQWLAEKTAVVCNERYPLPAGAQWEARLHGFITREGA